MSKTHTFTKREEIANATIHGIGAVLSVVALLLLIVMTKSEPGTLRISLIIYGVTMLLLYLASTLVHSVPEGKLKDIFEIMDHAAIYLFIAGSYTPIFLNVIQGTLGSKLLGVVWTIAIIGVVFKIFFVKRFIFMSTIFYILMGWMAVFAWQPLIANLPQTGLLLIITGGLSYTVGTIFYVWRGFPFHHAIWHLFVLAGSTFQFFSMLFYVL